MSATVVASVLAAQSSFSITDLFAIGIGPSSSHTVGPMRAAKAFAESLSALPPAKEVSCDLYGSLALTGPGHGTDRAVILGLAGHEPDSIDPDQIEAVVQEILAGGRLRLNGGPEVAFDAAEHLRFHRDRFLPEHPNGMRFGAVLADGGRIERAAFSVGGGAVRFAGEVAARANHVLPLPFETAADLLRLGAVEEIGIAEIALRNEEAFRERAETLAYVDRIRAVMFACMDRGMTAEGVLPGGLRLRRRAKALRERLGKVGSADPAAVFDWVSLYALAVSEENAAGGRVVTAPTNGAAGVIPAVLRYYEAFCPAADLAGSRTFLLTAAAIGMLYKMRASVAAAEVGCQGEVGVACSMAAAGLAAALGGDNRQIENAAEIGMEHNLGLTCDPIGGLVQAPCIERNTMGAVKAINAARLALRGDGEHLVSLDAVIATMRETGLAMDGRFKETSLGGLAVNAVEC